VFGQKDAICLFLCFPGSAEALVSEVGK